MLARASSKFTVLNWSSSGDQDKWQTRPLVRGGARYRQNSNSHTVINIWSWAPDGARNQDALTDWSSVVMWLWLWLMSISYWRVWKTFKLLVSVWNQYRRDASLRLKSYDGKGAKWKFSYGWQVMPKINQSTQSRAKSNVLRMASEPRELQL
jgi:hypothetical protein